MRTQSPATSAAAAFSNALSRRHLLALLGGVSASAVLGACASAVGGTARPPSGTHAFFALIDRGDLKGVEGALDADARLARAVDAQGRSGFVMAYIAGFPAIAALLKARGHELDLVESVLEADWPRVETLAAQDPTLMLRAHAIGGTPLYASALCGGAELYRLRSLGCESDARPPGGSGLSPARAAMNCRDPIGALLTATDILSNGGSVNEPQAGGDSVLHGAVRARDLRLVRLVLRKGGDVRARDARERRALDLAVELEWADGIALLEGEAQVARDHRASRFAFKANREPFRLDPLEDMDRKEQSAITGISHFNRARVEEVLAANPRLVHAISTDAELAIEACGHTGQREIIRLHLEHGAPLSLPTAISLGDLGHARWLLSRDPALIHERGPHDFPLMWYPAIGEGSVEAAQLLLEHGANLEQESCGETALHWAAMRGHVELVRYLADRGADLAALSYREERSGNTPLQLALADEHEAVAVALREFGARG